MNVKNNVRNAEDKDQPSYYAVIPASVRYDKNIPSGAKLLYGEISSLCNKEGYCWAGNAYFADLYQTSERTIINWINTLRKCGYISVSFSYVPGKKEIQSRFIRLKDPVFRSNKPESDDKPTEEDASSSSSEVVKISSPRSENNFTTYGKNLQEVVKNFSKGSEKNFTDNTKYNNKNTTSSGALHEQPPDDEKEAEENVYNNTSSSPNLQKSIEQQQQFVFTQNQLKNALETVDKTLFLDNFYPQAVSFMAKHNLDINYLSFIYDETGGTNYKSFKAMYYTLFFKDSKADEYKARQKPTAPPPPENVNCPACGTVHVKNIEMCPNCSLPKDASSSQIDIYRLLTPEKLNEYQRRENLILSEYKEIGSFNIYHEKIKSLKKEFGLTATHEKPSRSYHP